MGKESDEGVIAKVIAYQDKILRVIKEHKVLHYIQLNEMMGVQKKARGGEREAYTIALTGLRELGLLSIKTYEEYRNRVLEIVDTFKLLVEDSRDLEDYKIVGYGAAAKGMTLLNFAQVDLDFIIDDNPLKQGLLTPGRNTKICSIDALKQYTDSDKILFVPLAWNFYEEIRERIKKVRNNKNDMFLKYFPRVILEK